MKDCRICKARPIEVLKHETCIPCANNMRSWKKRPAVDRARRMVQVLLAQRRLDLLDTIIVTARKFRDGKVIPFRKKRTTLPQSVFKRNRKRK